LFKNLQFDIAFSSLHNYTMIQNEITTVEYYILCL